jgi:hypothetical protein
MLAAMKPDKLPNLMQILFFCEVAQMSQPDSLASNLKESLRRGLFVS